MPEYRVEWAIDVEAVDVYAAASDAWEAQRADGSIANVFEVSDKNDMTTQVDLAQDEVSTTVWMPGPSAIADLAEWMHKEQWDFSEIVEMIRRPHKYADEYSKMIVDKAFDEVALEPEEEDTDSSDETTEEN